MKKIRVLFIILIVFMSLFMVSGCGIIRWISELDKDSLAGVRKRARQYIDEKVAIMFEGFKTKDINSIKTCLAPMSKDLFDIDDQIQSSLDIIDEDIVSYTYQNLGAVHSTEHSRITEYSQSGEVTIKTNTNNYYTFYLNLNFIGFDESITGITDYTMWKNEEPKRIYVGYNWDSQYVGDCAKLLLKIVKAIETKDHDGLKSLFSIDVINKENNIDEAIDNVINNYSGHLIYTEREDGIYNDWAKDFHTRVFREHDSEDYHWVYVFNYYLKTDASKNYHIDYMAHLKNDDPNKVGLTYLSLSEMEDEDNMIEVASPIWEL